MMSNKKIWIVIRAVSAFFFGVGFTYFLVPEFVGRYRLLVILFFIILVAGLVHYRKLQRNLKKDLAQREEKILRRQKKLQKDFDQTMMELVTMQSEIREQYQKVDELVKKKTDT